MIKWINKLKNGDLIKVDKILHFFAGTIICLSLFLADVNIITIFLVVTIIAFLTEVYDKYFKSGFSFSDMFFTQLGFIFASLIKFIIETLK